jgi:hypothetical protein
METRPGSRGLIKAIVDILPFSSCSFERCQVPRKTVRLEGDGNTRKTERGLGEGWRRAGKQLGMPVAGNSPHLENRLRDGQLDQRDDDGGGEDRSSRVEHDAQRTVIGVADDVVRVHDLGHGQKREQNEAHHRNPDQGSVVEASRARLEAESEGQTFPHVQDTWG